MDGILLLDKPLGITSFQAIAKIRKKFNIKKVGHAGTLDPEASGLLIVMLGRVCKLARYAEASTKMYEGSIRLGLTTDTDDLAGEILSENPVPTLVLEEIRAIINEKFLGEIMQLPPRYSALKVNGKRAYDLARKGVEFELKSRAVKIYSFDVDIVSAQELSFHISCSKGTYIRSVARDLGEMFECGGTLASLRRTAIGQYNVAAAKKFEDLRIEDIMPWESLFEGVPRVEVAEDLASKLQNGSKEALSIVMEEHKTQLKDSPYLIYQHQGSALGLLENSAKKYLFAYQA